MPKPIIFELAAIAIAAISYCYDHGALFHLSPPVAAHAGKALVANTSLTPDAGGAVATRSAAPAAQGADLATTAPANSGLVQAIDPAHVKTAVPEPQTVSDTISVMGKLSLDQGQVRIAVATAAGRLGRIFVTEGQAVQAGAPLAEIYSPDYLNAEQEFVLARRFSENLPQSGGDAELRKSAAAMYQECARRLKLLGASAEDVARLAAGGQVQEYLRVRAPITGQITQRDVQPGAFVNVGETLMAVANTGTLWLYFNTYDPDNGSIRIGESVNLQTGALPGDNFACRIAFIGANSDPVTHTVPVRCDVANPEGRLQPDLFVSGALKTGERAAWRIPRSAVYRLGGRDYVFVQEDGAYQRLRVRGYPAGADRYVVVEGLEQPSPVVIDGAVTPSPLIAKSH